MDPGLDRDLGASHPQCDPGRQVVAGQVLDALVLPLRPMSRRSNSLSSGSVSTSASAPVSASGAASTSASARASSSRLPRAR